VSSLKNDAAQAQQLLVEAYQRLGRVKDEADAKLAEHVDVTAQLDQIKNEKVALENERALLQAEVHDRIGARGALIQEMAILHRHFSDLQARQEHQVTEVSQLGNRHAELRNEIERERERANSELAQILADTEKRRTEHVELGNQVAEVQKNVADLLAQKGALEQAVGEMVAKREQLHEEVAALETSLRVLNAAVERAEQARGEEGLPLLFGSEFHPISHEWDSYALESEFHTDEELDAETVAELVAQLPGLEGCLIVKNHGPVLAAQLPERLHAHLKVPNRNYNLLFERLEKKVQEYNLPNARLATFDLGDEGLTVAQANHAFVFVNHKQTKLRPGIPDKLASIATEVAKMYP
jgi:DNA repair exonuclease SbcCD ATPase subunit